MSVLGQYYFICVSSSIAIKHSRLVLASVCQKQLVSFLMFVCALKKINSTDMHIWLKFLQVLWNCQVHLSLFLSLVPLLSLSVSSLSPLLCFFTHKRTHTHTHVRTHTHMHTRMHARTHTHTHRWTSAMNIEPMLDQMQQVKTLGTWASNIQWSQRWFLTFWFILCVHVYT